MRERTLRRSQVIAPAGVGAIVDILGESFVGMDTTLWGVKRIPIRAPRIAAHLGVPELRLPPDTEDASGGLPYVRFPTWLFCGSCRRIERWSSSREVEGEPPSCQRCTGKHRLIPMRFVVICGSGHLDDVNWKWWAHAGAKSRDQAQCGTVDLFFENVPGAGGGLESVQVRCGTCGAKRSLQGIAAPAALGGLKCRGTQPWLYEDRREACDGQPIIVQRGASSVYFPLVSSAIDIPPDSDWAVWGAPNSKVLSHPFFQALQSAPNSPAAPAMIPVIAKECSVVEQVIWSLLAQARGAAPVEEAETDLRQGEWRALCTPPTSPHAKDNFISHRVPGPGSMGGPLANLGAAFAELVAEVVVVDRLREIRALRGFHRHTMDRLVPPSLNARPDFLPAIEVFGEGIFLRLDEDVVAAWETQAPVRQRADVLARRLSGTTRAKWLDAPTARSIMIHTLAHLLLRELTFDAGYSASALRERTYVSGNNGPDMAGALIYTAAGDSEGSMGGLARLGDPERLTPVLARMLAKARWCSLDPVCGEATAQGPDSLSLASCHACSLLPETSCEQGNVLLDRRLLIDPVYGFLAGALVVLDRALARG